MIRSKLRMLAVAVCLVGVSCSRDVAAKEPTNDPKAIEGLWSGAWGLTVDADGAVHTPVRAELFVKGSHVELYGFPKIDRDRLTGTVRVDAGAKQIQVTPTADDGQPTPKTINYAYEIKGDKLTLIDRDKFSISLYRHRVAQRPLANAQVEIVAATGINDAGDLLVTEFTVLRAGRVGATYLRPVKRSLKTKQAIVLVVQETGWKKTTVDEARRLIHEPTPVVVAYRHDDRPSLYQSHRMWKDIGPPAPDSEAVSRTLSRILRPGTLIFVLSASENAPRP